MARRVSVTTTKIEHDSVLQRQSRNSLLRSCIADALRSQVRSRMITTLQAMVASVKHMSEAIRCLMFKTECSANSHCAVRILQHQYIPLQQCLLLFNLPHVALP